MSAPTIEAPAVHYLRTVQHYHRAPIGTVVVDHDDDRWQRVAVGWMHQRSGLLRTSGVMAVLGRRRVVRWGR